MVNSLVLGSTVVLGWSLRALEHTLGGGAIEVQFTRGSILYRVVGYPSTAITLDRDEPKFWE